MDAIDRSLLSLLAEDASRPLKTLAAEVGLSRSSVRDRIVRMTSQGVIRRFTIETAPQDESVGAMLLVRLAKTPDPAVVQAISRRSEVARCYSLSGPIDLLVELRGNDVASVNRARDEIALLPGVSNVETSLILNRDKSSPA
ncbi:MAG TPA: Lrp/AsnC family transcriptional regulator [Sphingomicrobium sp.]|nr:Lrp/AsnC family transcriptional regulator [Sphingomicrobium sp.]